MMHINSYRELREMVAIMNFLHKRGLQWVIDLQYVGPTMAQCDEFIDIVRKLQVNNDKYTYIVSLLGQHCAFNAEWREKYIQSTIVGPTSCFQCQVEREIHT